MILGRLNHIQFMIRSLRTCQYFMQPNSPKLNLITEFLTELTASHTEPRPSTAETGGAAQGQCTLHNKFFASCHQHVTNMLPAGFSYK